MVHVSVSEFKNEISEMINKVVYQGERVLLQRHGKDVAGIVSMNEIEILKEIEEMEDKIDLHDAIKVLKSLKEGKTELIPWDKVKKDFGIK